MLLVYTSSHTTKIPLKITPDKNCTKNWMCKLALIYGYLFLQEKFVEYSVLDSILVLLGLINKIQLDRLNEQVNAASHAADRMDQAFELETEADLGLPVMHAVASPSENVSTMAEEGKNL